MSQFVQNWTDSLLVSLQTVGMQDDPNLSVPCPTCGSRVGQRWVLNTDQPRTTSHYARRAIGKDFFTQSAKAARKMADDAKDSSDRHSRDLVQMQRVLAMPARM